MGGINWVSARATCSIGSLFEQLKIQLKSDIDIRQALVKGPPFFFAFRYVAENNTVAALLEGHRLHESVVFRLNDNAIEVMDKDHKLLLTAAATLNDEGECRLKVGDQELELWQFRKRALENLFFSIPEEYMRTEESNIYKQNS
jgi:hypothetical protein